jgi:hypothetical protein
MVVSIVERANSGGSTYGCSVVRLGHVEAPGSHGSGSDVALGPSSPCQPHLQFQAPQHGLQMLNTHTLSYLDSLQQSCLRNVKNCTMY